MAKRKSRKANNGGVNRHVIRFSITRTTASFSSAVEEVQAIVMARSGMSTERISNVLGLSKGQVAYRIKKGNAIGARARFRNGEGWESEIAIKAIQRRAIQEIAEEVTPKFL